MSEISTKTAKAGTTVAHAGLRFAGDRLEPDRITALLGVAPTTAYRKGEIFKHSRGHEIRGRTGLWRLSSRSHISSSNLRDHLNYLLSILSNARGDDVIRSLRTLAGEFDLEVEIDCFWHGKHGAAPPEIPEETRAAFAKIGATIETDFQTD